MHYANYPTSLQVLQKKETREFCWVLILQKKAQKLTVMSESVNVNSQNLSDATIIVEDYVFLKV